MIEQVLAEHVGATAAEIGRSATTPGAVVAVRIGSASHSFAAGYRTLLPSAERCDADTLFDLASLTKLYTATMVAIAVERGIVTWDAPMRELTPGWSTESDATLLDVVEHVSGLPAWERFYDDLPLNPNEDQTSAARDSIRERILASPLADVGTHRYSDLGYLLLGFCLEDWFGQPLESTLQSEICVPLGLSATGYAVARPEYYAEAAATEWCSRRGRWVRGTVHDENCDVVGGAAGHAGIFSNAHDVAEFGSAMLAIARGQDGIISAETLEMLWSGGPNAGAHRGGWDTPTGVTSSVGAHFPRGTTFGHLGFTGTSIWVERESGLVAVLLTNRVHPSRENARIKGMRVAVHDAIWQQFAAS